MYERRALFYRNKTCVASKGSIQTEISPGGTNVSSSTIDST